jgi:hypothetical protein
VMGTTAQTSMEGDPEPEPSFDDDSLIRRSKKPFGVVEMVLIGIAVLTVVGLVIGLALLFAS